MLMTTVTIDNADVMSLILTDFYEYNSKFSKIKLYSKRNIQIT